MSDLSLTSTRDAVLFMGEPVRRLISKIHRGGVTHKGVGSDIRVDIAV
jgi:hypothetical protein